MKNERIVAIIFFVMCFSLTTFLVFLYFGGLQMQILEKALAVFFIVVISISSIICICCIGGGDSKCLLRGGCPFNKEIIKIETYKSIEDFIKSKKIESKILLPEGTKIDGSFIESLGNFDGEFCIVESDCCLKFIATNEIKED